MENVFPELAGIKFKFIDIKSYKNIAFVRAELERIVDQAIEAHIKAQS